MVVYADILIVLNFLIDYFLLMATSKILRKNLKTWRLILASFVASLFSLYIFLPSFKLQLDLCFKLVFCFIISFIAFGFINLKGYIRAVLSFLLVSCGYGGIIQAIWYIFRPQGMVIKNSVVYFNISPIFLVVSTIIFYLLFVLLKKIFERNSICASECEITIIAGNKKADFKAILDTGNSVKDVFGKSEIIIANKASVEGLLGNLIIDNNEFLIPRYRLVPCNTVSGSDILDGFRCDRAIVKNNTQRLVLEKPIVAVSKTKIEDGYNAIINPNIFE